MNIICYVAPRNTSYEWIIDKEKLSLIKGNQNTHPSSSFTYMIKISIAILKEQIYNSVYIFYLENICIV